MLHDSLVRSRSVYTLPSISARAVGALVDVDLAVGPVEALVAVATEGVPGGDAVAISATRLVGTVVLFCAMNAYRRKHLKNLWFRSRSLEIRLTFPSDRTGACVVRQGLEAAGAPVATG